MKVSALIIIFIVLIGNRTHAQLDKQQTLDYILKVYQDAYCLSDTPKSITCHYQILVVKYTIVTRTSSLKDSLTCHHIHLNGYDYWNVGTDSISSLGGIRTEDECKRLLRALKHLESLVKDDKDPFAD